MSLQKQPHEVKPHLTGALDEIASENFIVEAGSRGILMQECIQAIRLRWRTFKDGDSVFRQGNAATSFAVFKTVGNFRFAQAIGHERDMQDVFILMKEAQMSWKIVIIGKA